MREGGEQCHRCGNFSASWSDGFSRATIPCTDELSGSGAKCQRAGAARGPCWGPGPLHLATFPRIFSVLTRYNFHMAGAALSCHCRLSSQEDAAGSVNLKSDMDIKMYKSFKSELFIISTKQGHLVSSSRKYVPSLMPRET